MTADEGVAARQASIGGPGARAGLRVCAVLCWLSVAALAVVVFTTGMPWWAGVLAGLTSLLVLLPLGFTLWDDAGRQREDTERLSRDGRHAVAEVLDVELVDPGDGGAHTAVVRLRLSGDGVPPFVATHRGDADPVYRPGALLHATVDPSDNLFTLERLREA